MSYWEKTLRRRMTRRRAIAATGLSAAAAAFLAACGGDDDDVPAPTATSGAGSTGSTGTTGSTGASGSTGSTGSMGATGATGASGATSGLIHQPVRTTPKPGGILKHYTNADIDTFDATISATSQTVALSSEPFYPRMLGLETATYPNEAEGTPKGEVGESWEMSADRLTLTFKIRQGMKWDSRAPTNGRPIDSEDVMFSWNRFQELNGASLSLSANIDSVEAPDASTFVVHMASPDASILPLFAGRDSIYFEPREAEGGFDPRAEVRGHGPWLLDEYVPSSHFKYVKNPDYFAADLINFEGVEVPIVSDNATRLAQFRAGNIHTDVLTNSPEDIVQAKKDEEALLFLQSGSYSPSTSPITTFGWDPSAVWHDERNRQGISMLIDRDAYVDVIYNRDRFAQDGIDVDIRFNSMVPGGWGTSYWVDPTDATGFGEEAKYLQLNVEEAKKLFSAAGLPEGFEFDFYFNGGAQFGPAYARGSELYAGFFAEGGLTPKPVGVAPFDVWLSHYSRRYSVAFEIYNQNPHHSGVTFVAERTYSTLPVQIRNQMHPGGQGYRGMVPPGGSLEEGDPVSNELTVKINQEFDPEEQAKLVHELARYAAAKAYYITKPAAERALSLYWPAVGNVGVQVGYPNANNWADLRTSWWLDTSQPPFA